MKLLVVNANTSSLMTEQIDEQARLYAASETAVTTVTAESGPSSIESEFDVAISAVGTLQSVAHRMEAFDGFVVACGCDPGIEAVRELTSRPTLGIGEASMMMARLLGGRMTVMTALPRMVPRMEALVRKYGLWEMCASVRSANANVLQIAKDRKSLMSAFQREAREAINNDGADVICLAGAAMVGMEKPMQEALGVPVVDGVGAAVKLVEAQIACGVRPNTSQVFIKPEAKEAKDVPAVLEPVYMGMPK